MRVVADAGGCCGIKIIRDFYSTTIRGPLSQNYEKHMSPSKGHDEDQRTLCPFELADAGSWHKWPWPKKGEDEDTPLTAGEVFDRLVSQIKERRPAGLILVNLVHNGFVKNWDKFLFERGFTREDFYNSNSGNTVSHYKLIYDEDDKSVCEECGARVSSGNCDCW